MFDNHLFIGIHSEKIEVDRPVYVGLCISEWSKHVMRSWYYNHVKAVDRDGVQMLFTEKI